MILHEGLLVASEAATREICAWAYMLSRVADQIGAIRAEATMAKEPNEMDTAIAGGLAFAKVELDRAIASLAVADRRAALEPIEAARGIITGISEVLKQKK